MTALDYAAPPKSSVAVSLRLSGMMFLQYAVWGVWMPYLASYLQASLADGGLNFSPAQIGWIMGLAASIGAVTAPLLAGQVADRYLNAERALALLLITGGTLNFVLAGTHGYGAFLLISIAYSIVYMPTLSLSNSIAFQNLDDAERQFPAVRMWGTIGWIVASVTFTRLWLNSANPAVNTERIADALRVSGALSVIYGLFAVFVLPKTPPKANAENPLAFTRAFGLVRDRTFLLVTLVALPIAMIHQVYFFRAAPFFETVTHVSKSNLGPVLAIGQASEIGFLLVLGLFIKRLGYKWVLIAGCAGYALRFGIFALGTPTWLVITSQALHGLCYGCFFAGSFLLVEKLAPADVRHSAQTVFGIIILGLGPVLAGLYNQKLLGHFEKGSIIDYRAIWWVQSAIALAGLLLLLFGYRTSNSSSVVASATPPLDRGFA